MGSAAYHLSWIATGLTTLSLPPILWLGNTGLSLTSFLPVLVAIAALLFIHLVYARWRPSPALSNASGAVAMIACAGAVGGIIALAGQRLGAPLIDAQLALADERLGVSVHAITAWLAGSPVLLSLLHFVYEATVLAVAVAACTLAVAGRGERVWELCWSFSSCLAVCTLMSTWLPAMGAFAYAPLPPGVATSLPPGAGVFHLPVVEAYRSGSIDTISLDHITGLVTFPSFHACMALMTAVAFRGTVLIVPLWIWSALTMISTIPIGGHYVIDLIAGTVLWAASFATIAALDGRRRPAAAAALHEGLREGMGIRTDR